MGWRDVIGNFLEAFDKPAAPLGSAEDPFNYALQAHSNSGGGQPAVTVEALQTAFPGLSKPEAANELRRAEAVGQQALEIYYNVRDGLMSEAAAETQIKSAYPDISRANFAVLRARCHMATSK